jgi:hypothetical protein
MHTKNSLHNIAAIWLQPSFTGGINQSTETTDLPMVTHNVSGDRH